MKEAEKNVNGGEIENNINLETEDNSEEIWENIEEGQIIEEGPITDSESMETQVDHLENFIQKLSVEVAMGTDECYRRSFFIFL
jgi:hypothetical protein